MLALLFASKLFEVISTLLILGIAVSVPLIVVGGVLFFVLRRNSKNRAVWGSIANKLNFRMPNSKQLEMFGTFNDCEVKTSLRREYVSGSESNRTKYFTYCSAEFPQSLRFLLNINSPKGFLSGANEIQLGQPIFDSNFNAKCYDANVLRSLLLSDFPSDRAQNLMGDLLWARQFGFTIEITDESVYVEKSGMIGDENTLMQLIDVTTYLGNRFKAARQTFPLTEWERNLVTNWQNLANENGLAFDKTNFRLQGNYKNFPLFVELNTGAGKWQTSIKLNFPKSLMVGLKLIPENAIHKALTWVGVQDINVGIKEFDDAFIVKGKNIQMAKYLLKPDICQRLVILNRNSSALLVDDETIAFTYDTIFVDEKQLKSNIEGMLTTAKMLLR